MTEHIAESGVSSTPDQQPIPMNYWGTDETHRYELPDGVQWIDFKTMNEGDKAKFQRMTNQDLTIGRDNTAKVRMDPAAERHTLIETSVTGWSLWMPKSPGSNEMVQASFSSAMLKNWLQVAPPKIVEELELKIRKANPWMQADMKSSDIEEEIKRLEEQLREARVREAGEADSATK